MPEAKKKIGRPTLYKPEYCERVIEMGKEGKSPAQMDATLDVDRATLAHWGEKEEEFLAALSRARTFSQQWWEDKGQQALDAQHFQSSVWAKSMQSRFREDYTERRDMQHSGKVEVELPDRETARRAAFLLAKGQRDKSQD